MSDIFETCQWEANDKEEGRGFSPLALKMMKAVAFCGGIMVGLACRKEDKGTLRCLSVLGFVASAAVLLSEIGTFSVGFADSDEETDDECGEGCCCSHEADYFTEEELEELADLEGLTEEELLAELLGSE